MSKNTYYYFLPGWPNVFLLNSFVVYLKQRFHGGILQTHIYFSLLVDNIHRSLDCGTVVYVSKQNSYFYELIQNDRIQN